MNFGFSEEQELLRQEVRKFLDARCPLEEVRKVMETPEGFSRELWKQMGELGWIGLTLPEAQGGAGLGWVDLTVVLEEMGRTLFPSPYLATVLAASALADAGSEEQRQRWLPSLADGSRIASLALLEPGDRLGVEGIQLAAETRGEELRLSGEKIDVLDATSADLFVVAFRSGATPHPVSLAVLESDAPGVRSAATPSMDLTKRVGRLQLDGAVVTRAAVLGEAGAAAPALERIFDRGAAAVTAEMIGAAEGAVGKTVEYAREREQFGERIGRFQGVKHPLAEMFVDVESFKSLLYYGAWCLDEGDPAAARTISLAKAYASEAFARIGVDGVQLHGGVGYTWEYDIQMYLKRSKWARPTYGDSAHHYDRVAALGGYA